MCATTWPAPATSQAQAPSASTVGAPTRATTNCDTAVGGVYLCGYELARNLDFDDATSYRSGSVNAAWTSDTGWTPIGDASTER